MFRRVLSSVPYVVIVVGLVLLVRPVASSWIEAWEASQSISQITDVYDAMNDPERSALYDNALRYNELLADERAGKPLAADPVQPPSAGDDRGEVPGSDSSAVSPYDEQLSFRGSEMIAYISIPKCSIRLPIYHGTEEKELMSGVGHMKGSSLPVGGPSSHCVLTAHTGIPGKLMFDDIRLLQPGDRFVIWTLGRPLAYEVTGSEVVLPDQTESLSIRPGEDQVTLVTCTPVSVNSHRLLVHAKRCDYVPDEEVQPAVAVYVNDRTAPLLVAIGALAALAIALLLVRVFRRRRL